MITRDWRVKLAPPSTALVKDMCNFTMATPHAFTQRHLTKLAHGDICINKVGNKNYITCV